MGNLRSNASHFSYILDNICHLTVFLRPACWSVLDSGHSSAMPKNKCMGSNPRHTGCNTRHVYFNFASAICLALTYGAAEEMGDDSRFWRSLFVRFIHG